MPSSFSRVSRLKPTTSAYIIAVSLRSRASDGNSHIPYLEHIRGHIQAKINDESIEQSLSVGHFRFTRPFLASRVLVRLRQIYCHLAQFRALNLHTICAFRHGKSIERHHFRRNLILGEARGAVRLHLTSIERDAVFGDNEGDRPIRAAERCRNDLHPGDGRMRLHFRLDLCRTDEKSAEPQHVTHSGQILKPAARLHLR